MKFTPVQDGLVSPEFTHTWHYCNQCRDWVVICGTCGNNCCNGGSGKTAGIMDCGCDEAYHLQSIWDHSKECEDWYNSPEYARMAKIAEAKNNEYWRMLGLSK